jgi:hypothetical protein
LLVCEGWKEFSIVFKAQEVQKSRDYAHSSMGNLIFKVLVSEKKQK